MESTVVAASTAEIEEFIKESLVLWVESCLHRSEFITGYDFLFDGFAIHKVWLQIDPESTTNLTELKDLSGLALAMARAKNFGCIIRNIKRLFEEDFGQTILLLPDCLTLGYHPRTKQGLEEMKLLLTLLLGAAVQCPNKELFIEHIQELDIDIQHSLVELIKQVTVNHSCVLREESVEVLNAKDMYNHVLRLARERDNIYLRLVSAACPESVLSQPTFSETLPSLSLPLLTVSLLSSNTVELADLKSQLRKLRQELYESSENQLELREELDHKNAEYEKLRVESQVWQAEAKHAAEYRDVFDELRERSEMADKLEVEVQKLRDKLADSDFLKIRVEELREDNRMLFETKEMLEEELKKSRESFEHVMTLKYEIIKYKQKLTDLTLERDADRSAREALVKENAQLQLAANNTSMHMDKSLSNVENSCCSGDSNLSQELMNSLQNTVLKLESKNQRLSAALDQTANEILQLEKDKKQLRLTLEEMLDELQSSVEKNTELHHLLNNALEENKKIRDTLNELQEESDKQSLDRAVECSKILNLEKQVESSSQEKKRYQRLYESMQMRAENLESILEERGKEIERYAEILKNYDETKELKRKTSGGYVNENARSLCKNLIKGKENLEENSVLLNKNCMEHSTQTRQMNRLLGSVEWNDLPQIRVTKLETINQKLLTQHEIDLQTISTLRNKLINETLAFSKVRHKLDELGIEFDFNKDSKSIIFTVACDHEFENIQTENEQLQMENSELKLQITKLTDKLVDPINQSKLLETQYSQTVQQQNRNLDSERKALMENLSDLLKRYHELLNISLEDKKHFHAEEKSYVECMHNLNRQNEKLEKKIMKLLKKSENVQIAKKKRFTGSSSRSSMVVRAKKASFKFMNKLLIRRRVCGKVDEQQQCLHQYAFCMKNSESGSGSIATSFIPTLNETNSEFPNFSKGIKKCSSLSTF
uniref:HOOK N-terminal domain-containing protein n=1 Tax=Glossina brevipalpis TaxID=37001 RepID=A0A1A9WTV2_9MUSC